MKPSAQDAVAPAEVADSGRVRVGAGWRLLPPARPQADASAVRIAD